MMFGRDGIAKHWWAFATQRFYLQAKTPINPLVIDPGNCLFNFLTALRITYGGFSCKRHIV
jgi:hypothetical protein|tara:strand:- start:615 stop:797 length:183 start_codon:yes stop_codon:yes gene_type:complete